MGIFSFFRKRKEKVNIKEYDIPTTVVSKVADEEIYFERVNYIENKCHFEGCFNDESKLTRMLDAIVIYEKKANDMLHKYYFLKLFSRVAKRDNRYNERIINLDKQVNMVKKNYDDIKRRLELIKYKRDNSNLDYNDICNNINITFNLAANIKSSLSFLEKEYFRNLKMATYSLCNHKSYQELDQINKNITEIVKGYKSYQEIYDYIYYNSGEIIINTIKSLVKAIEKANVKTYIQLYSYNYFLLSDDVVVLRFAEWIDLFNKILYVIRATSKINLFSNKAFKENYLELEKRYMIILIYNESEEKQ